jgi:hypothetical protein
MNHTSIPDNLVSVAVGDSERRKGDIGLNHPSSLIGVLGIGLSGTSLCSHVLSALGIGMANTSSLGAMTDLTQNNSNGDWGCSDIANWHNRILGHFDRSYLNPLPLPVGWWVDPEVLKIEREIVAYLKERIGGASYFGFSDARTIRLIPVWKRIATQLQVTLKLILCLREPRQVARSLQECDGIDCDLAEYLWFVSTIEFAKHCGDIPYCIVNYDEWPETPEQNLNKIMRLLEINPKLAGFDLRLALPELVAAQEFYGHTTQGGQPLSRLLYKLIRNAENDRQSLDQVQRLVLQFVSFQQHHAPVYRLLSDAAVSGKAVAKINEEFAALQTLVGEVDRDLMAIKATALAVEHERDEHAAAQERLRTELAGAQAALSEREAALANARAQEAEAQKRLSELLAEIAEHQALVATAAANREVVEARAVDAETELKRRERDQVETVTRAEQLVAEAAAAEAALRNEVAALSGQLTEARDWVLRAEADGAKARSVLAQVEEQAGRAREDAADMREQLEVARAVGARLVAAFRSDLRSAATPPLVVRQGRWQLLRHLSRFRRIRLNTI